MGIKIYHFFIRYASLTRTIDVPADQESVAWATVGAYTARLSHRTTSIELLEVNSMPTPEQILACFQ